MWGLYTVGVGIILSLQTSWIYWGSTKSYSKPGIAVNKKAQTPAFIELAVQGGRTSIKQSLENVISNMEGVQREIY